MDNQFDQIFDCVTIGSTVLHQFESYLQLLSCMNILCSLRKQRDFEIGISMLCFRRRPQQVISAYRTVTSNVLSDENDKLCIFQILPVDDPRSYV